MPTAAELEVFEHIYAELRRVKAATTWRSPTVWLPFVVPALGALVTVVLMYSAVQQLQKDREDDRAIYRFQRAEDRAEVERLRTRTYDHLLGDDGFHPRGGGGQQ